MLVCLCVCLLLHGLAADPTTQAWTMYGRKSVGLSRKNPSGESPGFEPNLEAAGFPEACVFWHSHSVVKPVVRGLRVCVFNL